MTRKIVAATMFSLALAGCGGDATGSDDGSGTESSGGTSGVGGVPAGGSATGGAASGGSAGSLPPQATTCEFPADCQLRSASCCGSCGAPSRTDLIAINADYATDYATDVCGDQFACPACAAQPDNTLLATCEDGQCVAIDLLEHGSTACADASECVLHTPECCECGGSTDEWSLIAISVTGSPGYGTLVCDPRADCASCEPVYPDVETDCLNGHCQVVRLPP